MNPALLKMMSGTHRFLYRLTGGTLGGKTRGAPVLLLTTVGRKSGQRRVTPLLYLEDGENLVVIASNGGNPRHPAWWLNLRDGPEAEVQTRRKSRRVRAEEAKGEDRERLWHGAVEMYSGYADYQQATQRLLPVVILRPTQ